MMNRILILLVVALSASEAFSQQFFEVSKDPENGTKVLKGIITKRDLSGDTAFKWFQENQVGYNPNKDALAALSKYRDSIQLVVFTGTWCSDSKYVIPRFFKLLDSASFPENRITMIGVDRNKTTISHLTEAFNVLNVPTLIVMKNGKELGRVVEYGKYGMFDKELGEIITGSAAK